MLRNVVSIVSGGASGLGAATVDHIIRHGGKAMVADLPKQFDYYLRIAAEATAIAPKKKEKEECVIGFSPVNILEEDTIKEALDLCEEKFGEPINVCINCAGINDAKRTLFRDEETEEIKVIPLEDFSKILNVNALGTFNMSRLAAQRMTKRPKDADGLRGCIINTASIAAEEGQKGQISYSASKGAIVSMTLPLSRDLASYGIRVMAISPGIMKSPLLDNMPKDLLSNLHGICPKRMGYPDEYAKLVTSILTNPYLNGTVIRLDGAFRLPYTLYSE